MYMYVYVFYMLKQISEYRKPALCICMYMYIYILLKYKYRSNIGKPFWNGESTCRGHPSCVYKHVYIYIYMYINTFI